MYTKKKSLKSSSKIYAILEHFNEKKQKKKGGGGKKHISYFIFSQNSAFSPTNETLVATYIYGYWKIMKTLLCGLKYAKIFALCKILLCGSKSENRPNTNKFRKICFFLKNMNFFLKS